MFNVGGKSFIWIRKSKGPKIVPWGTTCFTLPQFDYALFVICDDFISVFCFLPISI
jgi:hypothetical protein